MKVKDSRTSAVHSATDGFSKKVENLAHAVSLHYTHYIPAMAAGKAESPWTVWDIARLLD